MREPYSTTPRCEPCRYRAMLDRAGAERLARAAPRGGLVAFPCPHHAVWHVYAPHLESPDHQPLPPLGR